MRYKNRRDKYKLLMGGSKCPQRKRVFLASLLKKALFTAFTKKSDYEAKKAEGVSD